MCFVVCACGEGGEKWILHVKMCVDRDKMADVSVFSYKRVFFFSFSPGLLCAVDAYCNCACNEYTLWCVFFCIKDVESININKNHDMNNKTAAAILVGCINKPFFYSH